MVRNVLGVLLPLAGAAAAVWSPFRNWYGGRLGRSYQVGELFTSSGVTGTRSGLWTGLFLPMLAVAVLTLLAVLARSRLLVALAGLLVIGFAVLWMIRQGQDAGTLTAGAGGLGDGVGYAFAGGALLLLASLVMRGRRPRGRRRKGRGRGRVDDGHGTVGAADTYDDHEHSEMPQPYGPFGGTTHGPHGAYRDDAEPPYGQSRDPYLGEGSTPAQEWDPWGGGGPPAQQPPQGPQQQPPPPPPPQPPPPGGW
jgi:hypothetical protein